MQKYWSSTSWSFKIKSTLHYANYVWIFWWILSDNENLLVTTENILSFNDLLFSTLYGSMHQMRRFSFLSSKAGRFIAMGVISGCMYRLINHLLVNLHISLKILPSNTRRPYVSCLPLLNTKLTAAPLGSHLSFDKQLHCILKFVLKSVLVAVEIFTCMWYVL